MYMSVEKILIIYSKSAVTTETMDSQFHRFKLQKPVRSDRIPNDQFSQV